MVVFTTITRQRQNSKPSFIDAQHASCKNAVLCHNLTDIWRRIMQIGSHFHATSTTLNVNWVILYRYRTFVLHEKCKVMVLYTACVLWLLLIFRRVIPFQESFDYSSNTAASIVLLVTYARRIAQPRYLSASALCNRLLN